MATDFRINVSFFSHIKTKRLHRSLGNNGVIALIKAWSYCAQSATDGVIKNVNSEDFEFICEWEGKSLELYNKLIELNFIEKDKKNIKMHDWIENQSWVSNEAARKKQAREAAEKRWSDDEQQQKQDVTRCGQHAERNADFENSNADLENSNTDSNAPFPTSPTPTSPTPTSPSTSLQNNYNNNCATKVAADDIKTIIEYYRRYHPHAYKIISPKLKEWKLIGDRIKEGFTIVDICKAIDGCHHSYWHQGDNDDGMVYDNLELIVRNHSKVQKFMEIQDQHEAGTQKRRGPKSFYQKTLEVSSDMLDRAIESGAMQMTPEQEREKKWADEIMAKKRENERIIAEKRAQKLLAEGGGRVG